MQCKYCKAIIDDDANFCEECGKPVEIETEAVDVEEAAKAEFNKAEVTPSPTTPVEVVEVVEEAKEEKPKAKQKDDDNDGCATCCGCIFWIVVIFILAKKIFLRDKLLAFEQAISGMVIDRRL